jgi:hypothetical protein
VQLHELFDALLTSKMVEVHQLSSREAESLRTALVRKFTKYKEDMTAIGFLDPTLSKLSLSREHDEENKLDRFVLRPRKSSGREYTTFAIVKPAIAQPASEVSHG